ncbi:L-xylulose reductase [Thrips palmi]|uniref:L-xylulose reductase n=1 Tax=Thrips palmi TaxID=161013 RepID=A0A6P8Z1N6_THRPL|nr:L-xylulose reductase [Thrips palmi]
MATSFDFSGKRVVVTGAGRGIGRDLVIALVAAKAQVVAVSRTQAHLDSLAAQLGATAKASLQTVAVDLGDWDATRAALANLGPVDGLVNNAGVACLENFLEMTKEGLNTTLDVNLSGVLNVSQLVAQGMVKRGKGGSIVNVSSQASMAALASHTAYAASKAGVDMASRVMALELGKHNIRVNCVNPTVVLTDMSMHWLDPVKGGPMMSKIPLGRFAEVKEVVDAILFLLSDNAAMINAVTLPVDGGFLST